MTLADRYGVDFPATATPASIELALAFRPELYVAEGWLGRYAHLRNAIELIWNEPNRQKRKAQGQPYDPRKHNLYLWHDWSEEEQRAFCESHWSTAITGPNASGKTTGAALYALSAFYASPHNTSVVMTTTTLPGLRKRVWKEVMKYHGSGRTGIGLPHATDYALRYKKGSDEAGVFGIATGQTEGEVDKAVNKIIGYHNTHVIVIVDEAQATNEAIMKACVSLEAGADTFQLILLGNIDSELSAFGQACEPVDGWGSVNVESERWETRRGICIHFDGLKCPRVLEGDEYYPGLLTQRDIDSAIKEHGEDSPWFWQFRRGFPPPQGVLKTILTAPELVRGKAMEPPVWQTGFTKGVTLDTVYGDGTVDRCVLRLWFCGVLDDGLTAIAPGEMRFLKLEASKVGEPIPYQIARLTREFAEEHGVSSRMTATDSTAEGGAHAILRMTFGDDVLGVDFAGHASPDRWSDLNPKRANEVCDRKVTELYFRFRDLARNGQVRGLDRATANEFCSREYTIKGFGILSAETKHDMKKRTNGRSCDLSDNAVIAAELFRKRGLITSPVDLLMPARSSWLDVAREMNDYDSGYVTA